MRIFRALGIGLLLCASARAETDWVEVEAELQILLQKEAVAQLRRFPSGRRLFESFPAHFYPPVTFSGPLYGSGSKMRYFGSYDTTMQLIYFDPERSADFALHLDPAASSAFDLYAYEGFLDYLRSRPRERSRLVERLGPALFHEGIHVEQLLRRAELESRTGEVPLGESGDVIRKIFHIHGGRYLEQEIEAYIGQFRYELEVLPAARPRDLADPQFLFELNDWRMRPCGFESSVAAWSARAPDVPPLARRVSELEELRRRAPQRALPAIEAASAWLREEERRFAQLKEEWRKEWPMLSYRAGLAQARAFGTTYPVRAMAALTAGLACAQEAGLLPRVRSEAAKAARPLLRRALKGSRKVASPPTRDDFNRVAHAWDLATLVESPYRPRLEKAMREIGGSVTAHAVGEQAEALPAEERAGLLEVAIYMAEDGELPRLRRMLEEARRQTPPPSAEERPDDLDEARYDLDHRRFLRFYKLRERTPMGIPP